MGTTTVLLAGGVAGVLAFTVVWLVEGLLRPGYRPQYHPISALSLGPRGWIQVASFVVTGLLVLGFAIGVRSAGAGLIVAVLCGVVAVGLIGAGAFPMDPMRGYPPGAIDGDPPGFSARHRLHDQASIAVFLAVPAAAALSGMAGTGTWRWYSFASAIAGIGLLAWFATAYQRDAPRAGLVQRIMVTVNWTWLALLGLRLM